MSDEPESDESPKKMSLTAKVAAAGGGVAAASTAVIALVTAFKGEPEPAPAAEPAPVVVVANETQGGGGGDGAKKGKAGKRKDEGKRQDAVSCVVDGGKVSCSATPAEGKQGSICWTIDVACADGTTVSQDRCEKDLKRGASWQGIMDLGGKPCEPTSVRVRQLK